MRKTVKCPQAGEVTETHSLGCIAEPSCYVSRGTVTAQGKHNSWKNRWCIHKMRICLGSKLLSLATGITPAQVTHPCKSCMFAANAEYYLLAQWACPQHWQMKLNHSPRLRMHHWLWIGRTFLLSKRSADSHDLVSRFFEVRFPTRLQPAASRQVQCRI